jgi:hypothetical protein
MDLFYRKLKISKPEFLFQFQSHANYPTALAFSDTLNFLGIKNEAYEIEKEFWHELPKKFITVYNNNYAIVEDYDYVNISQLSEKYINKLNLTNNNKYLIFKYKNDTYVVFNDFLFNLINPKQVIFHVIESFSYILKSLIKLNKNNICFFNLSPQNIVFNLDCGEKPLLQNFQLSLQTLKLNESYITNIINKLDDYTYKPLEIHALFYLIRNDFQTISYSLIEDICENYVKNLSILDFFSEKYKESYKNSCISILKNYINKYFFRVYFILM